jgi:group I intron endonuclease
MEPYGIVYHAFNTANGKCYVGQTTRGLELRWREHRTASEKDWYALHRVINKHGVDAFVVTLVYTCYSDQRDLDAAELYFGEFFNALVPNGYSLRLGGAHGKMSKESGERMSFARSGEKNGMWGREHKQSSIDLIKEARRKQGNPRLGTGKRPKAVCQCGVEFLVTYPGRRFCSQKCYFKFDKEKCAERFATVGKRTRSKEIMEVATGKTYPSAREASRSLGMTWGSFQKTMLKPGLFKYLEEKRKEEVE